MTETTVQWLLEAQVIEWLDEVRPVEMRIHTKHLTEDGLTNVLEPFWEPTALSDPVTRASKLRERGVQGGWASRNWGVCSRSVKSTRGICSTGDCRSTWVLRERNASRISGEEVGIVNLSRDPSLHEGNVLVGRNFDWLSCAVQPRE